MSDVPEKNSRQLPESTYRFQFHKDFTFADASKLSAYLADLGVTHAYASPYLKAVPGSMHGYDVIDHNVINPELGGEAGLESWIASLSAQNLSHILDIVPNHMGVATNENEVWNEVLEDGLLSRYAHFFDIAWHNSPLPQLYGKVLLPLLGEPYATTLEKGDLKLQHSACGFAIHYYARQFPVAIKTYADILGNLLDPDLSKALTEIPDPIDANPESVEIFACKKSELKKRVADFISKNQTQIDARLAELNGQPGNAQSFDALHAILEKQSYRFAYWKNASDEINYRRFFDVNDLAAVAMEREDVFNQSHKLVLKLAAEGKLTGLRLDHPDGLFDPEQYFLRLQQAFLSARNENTDAAKDSPLYLIAEKILAVGETMPASWAIHGTSGYDFLNAVNSLFIASKNADRFSEIYEHFTGDEKDFADLVYEKKLWILDNALASELSMLSHELARISQSNRRWRDFTFLGLREGLRKMIACFPVYRSYVSARGFSEDDRSHIDATVELAKRRNPLIDGSVFDFIREILLLENGNVSAARHFAGKFQQLTSPVTAKGVEDTAFYIYQRLISINEVGGEPSQFGREPSSIHEEFIARQKNYPYALSALSTHDTKRSEDVRARINVLSELPDEWKSRVEHWRKANAAAKSADAPAADEEYQLYQTLIGAWPLDGKIDDAFISRIHTYLQKSLREAKLRTTWTAPNTQHETAVKNFVNEILKDENFLRNFVPFQKIISHFGLLNSLSQTLLRLTAPGVPDTYQGNEIWDFSLVDPDNRRPVDYAIRAEMLSQIKAMDDGTSLASSMNDGRIKQFVTMKSLHARREHSGLFSSGEYVPLRAAGKFADHIFAFARRQEKNLAVVIAPRLLYSLLNGKPALPVGDVWQDTAIEIPFTGALLRNVFTGQTFTSSASFALRDALATFPLGLFLAELK